jgi:hypothetical protein
VQTIELDVKIELKDYLHANYVFNLEKRQIKILIIMCVLFFLGAVAFNVAAPERNLMLVLLPPIFLIGLFLNVNLATRRHYASYPAIQESKHYLFSPAGIKVTSESSSGSVAWQNVTRYKESENFFFLYISNIQFFLIPKGCFSDLLQIETFRMLLKREVSTRNLPATQSNAGTRFFKVIAFWLLIMVGMILCFNFLGNK